MTTPDAHGAFQEPAGGPGGYGSPLGDAPILEIPPALVREPEVTWPAISTRIEAVVALLVVVAARYVPWYVQVYRGEHRYATLGDSLLSFGGPVRFGLLVLCLLLPMVAWRPHKLLVTPTAAVAVVVGLLALRVEATWDPTFYETVDLGFRTIVGITLLAFGGTGLLRSVFSRREATGWFHDRWATG